MASGWEYAIITRDGGEQKLEVKYAGPERVAHHDAPEAAIHYMLGEMGSKDWELVSVTASWRADNHYVTQYYFKRPHEHHKKGAEELVESVRTAAWRAALLHES